MGRSSPQSVKAGDKFNRLTVVREAGRRGSSRCWECACDCGGSTIVRAGGLRAGQTKSCGCLNKERLRETHSTHGKYQTKLYSVWRSMKGRCSNPNDSAYYRYGGRGIAVCQEWMQDFTAFEGWAIEAGYAEGLTIERIDNDGPYSPDNCTWIPQSEQLENTSRVVRITRGGETMGMKAWCRRLGVSYAMVQSRVKRGWDPNDAIDQPAGARGRSHHSA